MSRQSSSFDIIVTHAREPLRTATARADRTEVTARLDDAWAAATAAWPDLVADHDAFFRYLAERLPADAEPLAAIAATRASDLFLACGCARGDPAALAAFDREVLAPVARTLTRVADLHVLDEAKQILRARLLVGDGDVSGKIRDYAGRGKLESWVRMGAVRTIHNLRRKNRREVLAPDQLFDSLLEPDNLVLQQLKGTYRAEFKKAFEAAVGALSARDRVLLKQHLIDRLTSEELGVLHCVHRATASRWIVKAQEKLVTETRRGLMRQLGVSPVELESVMRLIHSRLEASVERLLEREGDEPLDL